MMQSFYGYHGTSKNHGNNIIREQVIYPSTKNTEWLGNGVYFWAYRSDADWWGTNESNKPQNEGYPPVVIIAKIEVDDTKFLDLDDSAQYRKFCDAVQEYINTGFGVGLENIHEAQCFFSNYYASYYGYDILAYTFSNSLLNPSGFNRLNKRQFCVKNTNIIKSLRMEDVDYAV